MGMVAEGYGNSVIPEDNAGRVEESGYWLERLIPKILFIPQS
ncbi:hypothetical protein CYPRO_2152 [Cyclonatronum proteinivorum]|uniref:Uncharacterized protein n=1 Tax=Cyclonatronum proteinivorum TaxID=1457365 RepID=A0A345ULP8_9BACT|nr:hypothetical protein CYPRO_2152 [Cyclonatronum proteinivorum]